MRTFRDVIDEKARLSPAAPLLFAPEPQSTLTYDDLRSRARAFAGGMQSRGIAPDAIVGFMLPNGVAAASIFLSAMYSGYIVLPINLLALALPAKATSSMPDIAVIACVSVELSLGAC